MKNRANKKFAVQRVGEHVALSFGNRRAVFAIGTALGIANQILDLIEDIQGRPLVAVDWKHRPMDADESARPAAGGFEWIPKPGDKLPAGTYHTYEELRAAVEAAGDTLT